MNPYPRASTIVATKAEDQGGGQETLRWDSFYDDDGDARQAASRHPPLGAEAFEKSFVEVGQTTQEGSFYWVNHT